MKRFLPGSGIASNRNATLAGTGAIVLWASSGVCYAVGARALGAMLYLSLTAAIGVLTIVAVRLASGGSPRQLFQPSPCVAVAGFLGVAVYSVMLVAALGMADDSSLGQVILLNYLWPVWIAMLASLLLEASPRPWLLTGATLLGFGGVAIARGLDTLREPPRTWLPHLLALGGGMLWAMYSVLLRKWRIPAEKGAAAFHFSVCALLAGILAGRGWRELVHVGPTDIAWILFGGIGPVGLAYHWWEIGIKRGNIGLIASLAYFIPIGSALLIGIFFREAMSLSLLPGAALIALGAWLGQKASSR